MAANLLDFLQSNGLDGIDASIDEQAKLNAAGTI
jgi:hypothetical protein